MKYRFKALERRRQPDQLDSTVMLANPRGWVAVFVVLITAVMVGVWGLVGRIPQTVEAGGLLAFAGGLAEVQAPVGGTVIALPVPAGETVRTGQEIARLRGPRGAALSVPSPVDGHLVAIDEVVGGVVGPGGSIASVEAQSGAGEPLQASLFVTAERATFIRPGQEVRITVPGVPSQAFGLLEGQVKAVSAYPLSDAALRRLTGSAVGAAALAPQGVGPRQVVVTLSGDAATLSGYRWTSTQGPPSRLQSRTPVSAQIRIGETSPFAMLLGG